MQTDDTKVSLWFYYMKFWLQQLLIVLHKAGIVMHILSYWIKGISRHSIFLKSKLSYQKNRNEIIYNKTCFLVWTMLSFLNIEVNEKFVIFKYYIISVFGNFNRRSTLITSYTYKLVHNYTDIDWLFVIFPLFPQRQWCTFIDLWTLKR